MRTKSQLERQIAETDELLPTLKKKAESAKAELRTLNAPLEKRIAELRAKVRKATHVAKPGVAALQVQKDTAK